MPRRSRSTAGRVSSFVDSARVRIALPRDARSATSSARRSADPPGSRIDGIRDLGEPQRPGPIAAQRSSHRGPVVQRRGHRPGHRRGPGLDPGARLGRRQPRDVDPGVPEGPGVIRVGPRAVGVAGPGRADIDQLLQKFPVGPLAAGSRLGRALLRRDGCHQGLDLRPQRRVGTRLQELAGLLDGGERLDPGRQVSVRRPLRPQPQPRRLLQGRVDPGRDQPRASDPVQLHPPPDGADQRGRDQDRGGQPGGQSSRPPLGPRPPFGRRGGRPRLLGPRRLGRPGLLRLADPPVDAVEVGLHPVGDRLGVAQAVVPGGGQAGPRQADQLVIRAAGLQPGEGAREVRPAGRSQDLVRGTAGERRAAREDLAQDRPQREDVGPLVHPLDLPVGLLGGHVGGRAQHAPRARAVDLRVAPRRRDDRLPLVAVAELPIVGDAAAGQDLGEAPVHHLHLAERPHHDVRRLEVAVHDAPRMGVGHRLGHAEERLQEAGQVG